MLQYHKKKISFHYLLIEMFWGQNWFWRICLWNRYTFGWKSGYWLFVWKYFITANKCALLFPFSLSLWLVPLKQSCGQCPKLTLLLHTALKCQLASSPSLSIRGYSEEFFFKHRHMFISKHIFRKRILNGRTRSFVWSSELKEKQKTINLEEILHA